MGSRLTASVGFVLLCLSCAPKFAVVPIRFAPEIEQRISLFQSTDQIVTDFKVGGSSHERYVPRLLRLAGRLGVQRLIYVPHVIVLNGVKVIGTTGCRAPKDCDVLIDARLEANDQVATLFHELTHVLHVNDYGVKREMIEAEIVAEAVAWKASQDVGLDTSRQSMSYQAQLPADRRAETLERYQSDLLRWERTLVDGVRQ